MATHYRSSISPEHGAKMYTSHSVLPGFPMNADDKDHFLKLLAKYVCGYFVKLNNFVIMGNHFHLEMELHEDAAKNATDKEVRERYESMWKGRVPPNSGYVNGLRIIDKDATGLTRLRKRLGSDADMMRDLKHEYSRYHNKKYGRKGYFWDNRYHSVPLQNGLPRVTGSAYIALNPIKAGIVERPEDYKWCGEGLRKHDPELWKKLITPGCVPHLFVHEYLPRKEREQQYEISLAELLSTSKGRLDFMHAYINRLLDGEEAVNNADVDRRLLTSVRSMDRQLNLRKFLNKGKRNLTNGIAVGSYDMILEIQKKNKRKFLIPRPLMEGGVMFATRVLK